MVSERLLEGDYCGVHNLLELQLFHVGGLDDGFELSVHSINYNRNQMLDSRSAIRPPVLIDGFRPLVDSLPALDHARFPRRIP